MRPSINVGSEDKNERLQQENILFSVSNIVHHGAQRLTYRLCLLHKTATTERNAQTGIGEDVADFNICCSDDNIGGRMLKFAN